MQAKTFDIDALLSPVPGDSPVGESLRYDSVMRQLAEARLEDDAALPQGQWERSVKRSDWPQVERLCIQALQKKSKDLQIAAWLAEAWLRMHGMRGFVAGVRLIYSLCSTYWDHIHPTIEDGDVEYRVGPFVWMNERLSAGVRLHVPIVDPRTSDEFDLTLAGWESALRLENLMRQDKAIAESADYASKLTRAKFLTCVSLTSAAYFSRLRDEISEAQEAVDSLEKLVDERLGDESPGMRQIRNALDEMQRSLREFGVEDSASARSPEQEVEMSQESEGEVPQGIDASREGDGDAPRTGTGGSIRSREDAYARLAEAAEYLQRTEPHSPTPYLVMRAVTWGRMPLTDLLQELVLDESDLRQLYSLLGMRGGR